MSSIDASIRHPFTCVVAGPSSSGKSTFVRNLLKRQGDLIDTIFDYVYIFIGTAEDQNPILKELADSDDKIWLFDVKKLYPNVKLSKSNFATDVTQLITRNYERGLKGCICCDDLMSDLSESELLLELFTKLSSHASVSVIHITQNLFFRGTGKRALDSLTIYRNTKILVLFESPMDSTVLRTIAGKMPDHGVLEMLKGILSKYRYVVIRADFKSDPRIRYTSDIFNVEPFPHQKVFSIAVKDQ